MSAALKALESGVKEVDDLLRADPTPPGGLSPAPSSTRAVLRAAVVLLCSHFERYVRAVSEEAVEVVNRRGVDAAKMSVDLRLQHSRIGIEQLVSQQWDRRANGLAAFVGKDGWLWSGGAHADIDASRLLAWMKSPTPKAITRAYKLWGVEDVFRAIARTDQTRGVFYLRLTELVEKRNNIAHGDFSVEATRADVTTYQIAVRDFCRRADAVLERSLKTKLGLAGAWTPAG